MKFKATVFIVVSAMVFSPLFISTSAFAELISTAYVPAGPDKSFIIYSHNNPPSISVVECNKVNGEWSCHYNTAPTKNIPPELKVAADKLTLSPDSAGNSADNKDSGVKEPGIPTGDGGLTIQK